MNIVYSVYVKRYKGKVHPKIGHEVPEGEYSFFNLGVRWGRWLTSRKILARIIGFGVKDIILTL
jgi:hypothetical protein